MAKKKIMYVAQSAGGVAEYLYMFLNNIEKEKYENVLVVSQAYQDQMERFKHLVDKIYVVPMERKIQLKSDVVSIVKLKKIMRIEKPNIVYLHSSKAGAIGRIALLFSRKIKILYNAHGWYFNADIGKKRKKIFSIIERMLALKTHKIINISQDEYNSAIKHKITKSQKMCIIENGIDFKRFENVDIYREETRRKYSINKDQIVIGVVGRLSEQKNPLMSIEVFKEIHDQYFNTKFMFIGSGELQKMVIAYAQQHNIDDDIIITGWVNDVEKYIPALDIAILPSKWEGFGLAIIEYMACDKAIVATDVGGISNNIKNGENGYLVTSKEELKEKILFLIQDEEKRQKFIDFNKKYRKKYNINHLIKKHIKLYEEIDHATKEEN